MSNFRNRVQAKEKEKCRVYAMEAKKRWEQCAEETMTRIRNASNTHNASISDSMTTLLQTYRSGFIAGQEYMESIQPNINKFIKYTEDVQSLKKRSESTRGMDSPPTERDSKLSSEHTKQPQKKSGIGRLIRKKSNLSNTNSKKEFDEFDELEESEKDSVELLEDTDSITFEFDPKTNEQIVRSADVPHLIAHMTHPSHIDISFRDAFFLLYRSFTTPLMVCSLIEENYYSTKDKDKKFRALAAFKFWLENYPADFIGNPELCEQFRKFLESSLARDNPSAENQLSASLNKIIEQNQTSSRRRHRIESQLHIEISLEHEQQARNILFEDLDPVVVAQQLTVLENRLFCAIKPMELLNKNWSGAEKATTAPNIIALTEHFNQTSRWVVNEIISKYSFKVRVETLKKFIAILQHARSLNNFCGVMSILAGVNSSPVRRLKSTWKELSESELQVVKDIERLMNHKGSYRCYRATLHSAKIPLVPFIGIYLKDLTFTEDGNPKYLDNLVNFSKCHKISTTVEEIIRYQVLYNIPPNPVLQCFLRNVEPIGEEEAYTLSTRIEPRDPSEAFENLLLEEDRLRKQVEELQLRVDDLKSMQNRQLTTVSILSDQVREQRKVIQQQSQQLASGKYDVELPVEEEKESRTDGPTRKITQVQLQDLFAQVAKLDVNENDRSSTDKWKSAASPQGSPRGERLKTKKKIIKKKVIGVGTGVALFDFTPENPDELSFKKNETITVLTTDESIGGEGWWIGLVDGKQGVFPKEYIIFTPHTKK